MYRIALSRSSYIAGGLVATVATGTLGASVVSQSEAKFAEALSWPRPISEPGTGGTSTSILLPSAQATLRSLRLVKTALLMAADYKLDEWGWSTATFANNDKAGDRSYWEDQVEHRRQALYDAQQQYTRDSHPDLAPMQRLEVKRQEKQAMELAAQEYAHAEESLAALGSRKSLLHRKAAGRLLDLCRQNKGVYIKVGQHIANLDYIVPAEYIEVLSSLFDDTPQTKWEDVRAVVQEELGADPDDLFDKFSREPTASASLAQVHVAYEKGTGRKLAVKVQHRGLAETSIGDLWNLVSVVRLAEQSFPSFTYGWLADEIAPHLPKELDFCNEARNAERAMHNLQRTGLPCVIPRVRWDKTSARVLTMEFEEGFKATEVNKMDEAGIRRRDVAHLISSVFASQVFTLADGFVHCDPHPANVLVRKGSNGKPELVLVDHGLYRSLDRGFQVNYATLWKALLLADLNTIRESCASLGVEKAYTLFAAMLTARPFDEIMERSKKRGSVSINNIQPSNKADQAMIRGYAQQYIHEIFGLLARLPRQMLLLLKMNDCLRHIDHELGSPTNTLAVTGRYAAQAVFEERARQSKSTVDRLWNMWGHWSVLWRLHLHDFVVWLLDQKNRFQGILLI